MDITYSDLIPRLFDLERLAEPPAPGERSGCYSSYDRRSHYDSATDTYKHWDANDDGSGYIRTEDEWIVAFEHAGPGIIWRVWSAFAYGFRNLQSTYLAGKMTAIGERNKLRLRMLLMGFQFNVPSKQILCWPNTSPRLKHNEWVNYAACAS